MVDSRKRSGKADLTPDLRRQVYHLSNIRHQDCSKIPL